MIDKKFIGHQLTPIEAHVSRFQVAFFADVIGETDPIYRSKKAACNAGYVGIPVPPTFLIALEAVDQDKLMEILRLLDLDLSRCLHGEQFFEFLKPICVGEKLTIESKIVDIYDKSGGALEFVLVEKEFKGPNKDVMARSRTTFIYRPPQATEKKSKK